jgi:hypothetical protein
MNLKTYHRKLTELLEKHPEAAKYKVITSCDEEGNGFNGVCYAPTIGYFDNGEFDMDIDEKNAVCLN